MWNTVIVVCHSHPQPQRAHIASQCITQRNLPQNIKVSGKMLLVIQSERAREQVEFTECEWANERMKEKETYTKYATACHHFVVLTNSHSHWGCELVALLWLTPSSDYLLVMENSLDANKMFAYVLPTRCYWFHFIYLFSFAAVRIFFPFFLSLLLFSRFLA